nr:prephenate dehydratase domain-containing protein [Halarcobacter anaerophilus]
MKKKSTIDKLYLINKKILKLLDEEIALIKSEPSLDFSALSKNLTKKLKKEKSENIDPSLIKSILFETLTSTLEYNNEKIVYLGPKGSYTQEAAINKFGTQNLYYSVNSIKNIFFEVNEGRATYGIVPIENSSNGIVGDTINCFNTYNLNIVGETVLDIHHTLVSNCKNVEDIKTIYSKDIAFDQCSIFWKTTI